MGHRLVAIFSIFLCSLVTMPVFATSNTIAQAAPYTATAAVLQNITPEEELKRLMAGNIRFVSNKTIQRNLLRQAKTTSLKGQFPAAVILSCMDSRGSPELIFDQGLGDVFSVRVAGNVVDIDQIGGMEFATKAVGSKVIMVMGHTQCGAVRGACQNLKLGNLTELLNKIKPAVRKVQERTTEKIDCNQDNIVNEIAKQNVLDMMQQVEEKSSLIHDQIKNKQILIIGAMHDLRSGKVTFFNAEGNELKT